MEWISLKDIEPKSLYAVLFYGECENEHFRGMEVGWMSDGIIMTSKVRPSHWMPLPEPPKLED